MSFLRSAVITGALVLGVSANAHATPPSCDGPHGDEPCIEEHTRWPLVIAGASAFALAYGHALLWSCTPADEERCRATKIPFGGPFLSVADEITTPERWRCPTGTPDDPPTPCGAAMFWKTFGLAFVVANGLTQIGGAALVAFGLLVPERRLVTPRSPSGSGITLRPNLSPGALGLSGTF